MPALPTPVSGEVEPDTPVLEEPDTPELELPEPDTPEEPELGSGVPVVPLGPGMFAPLGELYVPEVVGEVADVPAPELPELVPDEELEPILPDPVELQAPSTKTHARGMIHLFIKAP
ncbi:MAG: hypothetical protein JWQ21_1835 [Herminiimonas sp.]|nr:hypothetical protein [Herminiimonas sp.]